MNIASRFLPLLFAAASIAGSQTQLIGDPAVAATVDSDSAGQAEAFEATATFSGTVNTLSIYLDASNGAKRVTLGLYSNAGGHPATLLGLGVISAPVAGRWNTVPISPAVHVTSGTLYHIGLLGTGGTLQYRDTVNGTHSETSARANLTTLPAAWSTGQSWPSGPVSAYGSGAPTGGVQIVVSPASATVDQGGKQQFKAIVTGTKNIAVHWTVTSGSGTITSSGLFTAPSREETDRVRAQSQADAGKEATASITVPAVGISVSPVSATVPPDGTQQFAATVTGTVNRAVKWTEAGGGKVDQDGLYTAPATIENDTVTATATARPAPSAEAGIAVRHLSASACGNTLNWTNSLCQQIAKGALNTAIVNGKGDPAAWTVISRHGEYAQGETECNVPAAVSVANGALTIKATAASATCGDFDPGTGRQCSGLGSPCPGTFPYTTGDVQWNTFSFKYGVVLYRAQFPTFPTTTWPAIWMLGVNCQNSNKFTGDTGIDGCPNIGESGYNEVDNTELYGGPGGWGRFNIANPNWSVAGPYATAPIDGNYHVFATVWTPSGMEQYMDGQLEASTTQTADVKMFLIVQIQTGGAGGTPDNSLLPASLNLDYVKVCNAKYTMSECEKAASGDPNVIFFDDFGGPAK